MHASVGLLASAGLRTFSASPGPWRRRLRLGEIQASSLFLLALWETGHRMVDAKCPERKARCGQGIFVGDSEVRVEKAMATHSSTLAWKIPWTEEPGRLQSMGWLGIRHN